jgi:hypothetical protein
MSTLKTNTLSNVAGTASTAIENAINGSAKAWVNFNGTGTVAINSAYSVTSVTDNGVGTYTVNFLSSFADTNYAVCGSASNNASSAFGFNPSTKFNGGITVITRDTASGSTVDLSSISVAILR